MEHLLDVNEHFSRPCQLSEAWYWVGLHCNAKITKLMLNTRKKGYEFSNLVKSGGLWKTVQQFIQRSSGYSRTDPTNSERYKSVITLFEKQEVLDLLQKKARETLYYLVVNHMDALIEKLFEISEKRKWNINYAEPGEKIMYQNPLGIAVNNGFYHIVERLLNTGWFDINCNEIYLRRTPILTCAASTMGYDTESPSDNNNFSIFKVLLQQKGIDLDVKDHNGSGLVELLQMRKKYAFIDYLKSYCNNNSNNDDGSEWKMDEVTIDNSVRVQHVAESIITFTKRSDYKELSSILNDKSKYSKEIISEAINLVGTENQRTALHACVETQSGYDKENERDGNNFKCFKLLLSVPGIDPSIIIGGQSITFRCIQKAKVAFYEYLVEMKRKHKDDKNSKFCLIDPTPETRFAGTIFQWFPDYNKSFEIFELVFKYSMQAHQERQEMKKTECDVNTTANRIASCSEPQNGYDKNKGIECDQGKMFKLLLNDKNIDINFARQGLYPRATILTNLVTAHKYGYLGYIFEQRKDLVSKIEWDKHYNDYQQADLLFRAAQYSDHKIMNLLLKHHKWDINRIDGMDKSTLLEKVALAMRKWDSHNANICDNWKCFELVLKHPDFDIDINMKHKNSVGLDILDCLIMTGKVALIEFMIKELNLDKEEINKMVKAKQEKHKIGEGIVQAVYDSNYDKLKEIIENLTKRVGKDTVSDYICGVYQLNIRAEYGFFMSPLGACFNTEVGFMKQSQESCDNFQCLKYLLEIGGIENSFNIGNYSFSNMNNPQWAYINLDDPFPLDFVGSLGKVEFGRYVMSKFEENGWNKDLLA